MERSEALVLLSLCWPLVARIEAEGIKVELDEKDRAILKDFTGFKKQ